MQTRLFIEDEKAYFGSLSALTEKDNAKYSALGKFQTLFIIKQISFTDCLIIFESTSSA